MNSKLSLLFACTLAGPAWGDGMPIKQIRPADKIRTDLPLPSYLRSYAPPEISGDFENAKIRIITFLPGGKIRLWVLVPGFAAGTGEDFDMEFPSREAYNQAMGDDLKLHASQPLVIEFRPVGHGGAKNYQLLKGHQTTLAYIADEITGLSIERIELDPLGAVHVSFKGSRQVGESPIGKPYMGPTSFHSAKVLGDRIFKTVSEYNAAIESVYGRKSGLTIDPTSLDTLSCEKQL